MSNRKAQNSIIFLTTLGVYFGLLMVGGSAPQVFAHSATTRNFEITDEIEVKDDLDTNPDSFSDLCTPDPELSVSEDLARLYAFSVLRSFDESLATQSVSVEDRIAAWTDSDFNQGYASVFGPKCDGFQTTIKAAILADGEFNLAFRITSKRISDPYALMTFLQSGIESKRWRTNASRTGHLIRHTSEFIENDQLYIVTRLPRAGLDPLLAKDAK